MQLQPARLDLTNLETRTPGTAGLSRLAGRCWWNRQTGSHGEDRLQGWSRYFSIGTLEPAYRTVDRYTEALFRQFLVRRHKVPGRGTRPFSNRYLYEELGLVRLDDCRRMSRLHALT